MEGHDRYTGGEVIGLLRKEQEDGEKGPLVSWVR